MKHPNFEVIIDEVFQLNTFTMPKSIEMEIMSVGACCDTLVDRVAIDVPGEYVRTLTCTSQLIQIRDFSQFEYNKRTKKQNAPIDVESGKDAAARQKL